MIVTVKARFPRIPSASLSFPPPGWTAHLASQRSGSRPRASRDQEAATAACTGGKEKGRKHLLKSSHRWSPLGDFWPQLPPLSGAQRGETDRRTSVSEERPSHYCDATNVSGTWRMWKHHYYSVQGRISNQSSSFLFFYTENDHQTLQLPSALWSLFCLFQLIVLVLRPTTWVLQSF